MNNPDTLKHLNAIAIIGLSCRFPGARNVQQFWRNLKNGVESISFFSDQELRASGIDPALLGDSHYVKAGAVLEEVEWFDGQFFGYSPREAKLIDPQHRLFLECAWEAVEDAGYDPETYAGLIGVFAGAGTSDYLLHNIHSNANLVRSVNKIEILLGNNVDYLATRISYKLNLKGPSLSVQTACSASLVAVNMACDSLLNGQSDMAMAGGVSISLPQKKGYHYVEGEIYSPDGHCRAFDTNAQGAVFGSGIGIVVLKRLSDALEDHDHIYAVIKGSAINNDGAAKVGFTAPSVEGQASVIAEALAMSGIDGGTISYVETHGTGTPLGDPIEIAALTEAFRTGTDKKGFCPIGAVKTNIGHTFTAAGVAGLIKTVLALKHKEIPPSLHFEKPNPRIDFENSPFYVNTRLAEWSEDRFPRRAGVSSFGVGGTNAHCILEEAPIVEPSGKSRPRQLLLVSAKTTTALDKTTTNLIEHLESQPNLNIADIAYTLQVGRKAFDHRRMVVCQNLSDAVSALETLDPERVLTFFQEPINRDIVFMFSGQGSQYVDMGLELYRIESEFQKHIDRCSEILKPHLGLDLRDIMYPAKENVEEAAHKLKQTLITQPALFTIEYALAKLWMSWGVHPEALVGHSIGEYVAACLAGVFSLEDALLLVATRGRLMQELPIGSMLAVPLSEKEIEPFLGKELSLAAINGPSFCVVSGEKEAVKDLEKQLSKKNVDCRHLHTSHAFHSKMIDPILDAFTEQVKQVNFNTPQIPIISTVTGTWITSDEIMTIGYWAKNVRQTVRFFDCVQELLKEPTRVFLEVGPGQALSTLVRQYTNRSKEQIVLSSIRHPKEQKSDIAFILDILGRLWLAGIQVDWSGFYKDERRHRVPLPTYPFERQRYWIEPVEQEVQAATGTQEPSFNKADLDDWFYVPTWKRSPINKPYGKKALSDKKLCWLVFLDEVGLGAKLVSQLQQEGHRVTTVEIGTEFSQESEGKYIINPPVREDYQSLLKELRMANRIPNIIVHLWLLSPENGHLSSRDLSGLSQDLGFFSLLFLVQAVDDQLSPAPVQIKVISNNLHEVTGDEVLSPEKATLLGPCRVASQEYSNMLSTSVDIVLPKTETQQEILLDLLIEELTAQASEPVVAYRGRHRWVQDVAPVRLEEVNSLNPRLRENGVYLITGGLGGIGLSLAEYLAQTIHAKLALLARTALPPRSEWKEWLESHDEKDTVSGKIRKVQSIEAAGAEVLVLSANVTDSMQMKAAIEQTRHQFGSIHGVVHAAGIAGGGIMQLKTRELAESVLTPKVNGTLVLAELLNDIKLDFFALCSSINSLVGGIGQVDYCAANAFLDAYAHKYYSENGAISINWSGWQEVGMAVNTAVPDDLKEEREQMLSLGILPEEGKKVFGRILGSSFPQVVVSTQHFLSLKLEGKRPASDSMAKTLKSPSFEPKHARPDLSSVYVAPGNSTEKNIAEIWQELLGIEKVGIHDNFFDLGGHSLLVAQVIARLRSVFPIEFPMGILFEKPTVHLVSQMILEEQKEEPSFVESSGRGQKRKERKRQRMVRVGS